MPGSSSWLPYPFDLIDHRRWKSMIGLAPALCLRLVQVAFEFVDRDLDVDGVGISSNHALATDCLLWVDTQMEDRQGGEEKERRTRG